MTALPDPHRAARRSLRLLRRMGMTEQQAVNVITEVSYAAWYRSMRMGYGDCEWFMLVLVCAVGIVRDAGLTRLANDGGSYDSEDRGDSRQGQHPPG